MRILLTLLIATAAFEVGCRNTPNLRSRTVYDEAENDFVAPVWFRLNQKKIFSRISTNTAQELSDRLQYKLEDGQIRYTWSDVRYRSDCENVVR